MKRYTEKQNAMKKQNKTLKLHAKRTLHAATDCKRSKLWNSQQKLTAYFLFYFPFFVVVVVTFTMYAHKAQRNEHEKKYKEMNLSANEKDNVCKNENNNNNKNEINVFYNWEKKRENHKIGE